MKAHPKTKNLFLSILRPIELFAIFFAILGLSAYEKTQQAENGFEFGAIPRETYSSQWQCGYNFKTKSADRTPPSEKNLNEKQKESDKMVATRKYTKELLLFDVEITVFTNRRDYNKQEAAKVLAIFEAISTSKLGPVGYDIRSCDVTKARRIHVWPKPVPHGPIVIEFKDDETIKKVKKQ